MKQNKWFYTEKVREHFFAPKNFLTDEKELKFKADGIGIVGNPKCGDQMKMWIKVKNNKITDCRWQTFGCASALASTSILSEMAKGRTIEKALKITPKDIANKLGGLPAIKFHCSVLGDQALRAAIEDYSGKQKVKK